MMWIVDIVTKKLFKRIRYYSLRVNVLLSGIYYSVRTICAGDRISFDKEIWKDVLLCGNGPSLKEIDLEKVVDSGVDIAVVNFFPLYNKSFFKIKPKYLFLIDDAFFKLNDDKLLDDQVAMLWMTLKKVDWKISIITLQNYNYDINNKYIHFEKISNYSLYGDMLISVVDLLYRYNLVNAGGQNVIISALFYFVNKTKGTIYLSGVDMSEFKQLAVDENNDVYLDMLHDYGVQRTKVDVKNGGLYISLGWYQKIFEQFYYLAQYSKRRGVSIYNLSMKSYLDVFKKVRRKKWERRKENE